VIGAWIVAVPGIARLTWRDDIRELEVPAKELQAEATRIRAAFGQRDDRTVYLTHGATRDEARVALQALERWVGGRAVTANLGAVVPAPAEREAARRFVREQPAFLPRLRAALEADGFNAEEFAPFFEAYASYVTHAHAAEIDTAMVRLQQALRGPLSTLLHTSRDKTWFVTLASGAPAESPPAETQTITAGQLQSLNRLFAKYRSSALQLSLAGLAMVGLGVFLTYGLRDGVRIFAIPCGVCLGVFGVFGWVGQPLNLFHLLGAFLGVCLTHNYSIFSATSAFRDEPTPVSVRLSALTTAASFGVLATSGIPVVRALGVTVGAMVLGALVVIELEHLAPLAKKR
jgi:predicted exporter